MKLILFLAIEPEALDHVHVGEDFSAFSILFAILPHAIVCTTVRPHVNTKAVLLVVLVLTLVSTPVTPLIETLTMHLAIVPFTLVAGLSKCMYKLALPMEEVILEVTLVYRAIYSSLFTLQTLFAFLIHAFVSLSIVCLLPAFAMLAVVQEFALVAVFNLPISILSLQFTLSAGEAVKEHTSDHGPRRRKRLGALAVRLARNEASLILIAIWPTNLSFAIRQPFILAFIRINTHLSCINRSIRHRTLFLHLSLIHASHLTDVGKRIQCYISQFVPNKLSRQNSTNSCLNSDRKHDLPCRELMLIEASRHSLLLCHSVVILSILKL